MVRSRMCVLALIGTVALATAEEKPAPPKGGPPVMALAQATEKDGKIVVRFWLAHERPAGADYVPGPEGKSIRVIGARTKMGWADVDVVADGRTIRALTADGKAIDPKDLPKRLAKASRVVLFYGQADPQPYYLGLFRESVVLFVAPANKFAFP